MTTGEIAVVDYGIGNLRSAEKALQHVGARAALTSDPDRVRDAAGVVLPGVGAFGPCMEALTASGLAEPTLEAIDAGTPFLAICIGMQLLYQASEEAPGCKGLGVLPGTVALLPEGVKRPQMQWNTLEVVAPSGMLEGLGPEIWMYFVHSYAGPPAEAVVATCDYGGPVTAAVEQGNVWATQFHPEKSAKAGLAVLANFARVTGQG